MRLPMRFDAELAPLRVACRRAAEYYATQHYAHYFQKFRAQYGHVIAYGIDCRYELASHISGYSFGDYRQFR